jgi:hypothetical protein
VNGVGAGSEFIYAEFPVRPNKKYGVPLATNFCAAKVASKPINLLGYRDCFSFRLRGRMGPIVTAEI